MAAIRCRCGNKLGERVSDVYVLSYRGRSYVVRDLIAASCDRCGASWSPESTPPDAPPPQSVSPPEMAFAGFGAGRLA